MLRLKKCIALILALVMAVTMLPALTITAHAATSWNNLAIRTPNNQGAVYAIKQLRDVGEDPYIDAEYFLPASIGSDLYFCNISGMKYYKVNNSTQKSATIDPFYISYLGDGDIVKITTDSDATGYTIRIRTIAQVKLKVIGNGDFNLTTGDSETVLASRNGETLSGKWFEGGNSNIADLSGKYELLDIGSNIAVTAESAVSIAVKRGGTDLTGADGDYTLDSAGVYEITIDFSHVIDPDPNPSPDPDTNPDPDPDTDPDPVATQSSLSALTGTLSVKTKDTSDNRATNTSIIADAAKFTLNMETEKLNVVSGGSSFTVAGFSVDNGSKWKSGSPTDKDIANLFNKGGTLVLTNLLENKKIVDGKANTAKEGEDSNAVAGSILLTFPKIEKRAKDTKLIVNYGIFADNGTNGSWTLAKKNATATDTSIESLQIAKPADGKKMGANDKYESFSSSYYYDVKSLPDSGKVEKTTYFVRTAPYYNDGKFYPATKGYKVSVSSMSKAPNAKPDYKKEIIKPKAGMVINGAEYDKTSAKEDPYYFDDAITRGSSVNIYMAATDKKPRSATQTITPAKRAATPDVSVIEVDASKGKAKLAKGYEVYDSTKNKWGGLPKISDTTDIEVRAKSTAKQGKDGVTGEAASESVIISLVWGVYDEEKSKSGIIAATLSGDVNPQTYSIALKYNVSGSDVEDVILSIDSSGQYGLPELPSGWIVPLGKVFKGWSLTATGAAITTDTIEITGNIILYAVWDDFTPGDDTDT